MKGVHIYRVPDTDIEYREGDNRLFFHLIAARGNVDWIAVIAPDMVSAITFAGTFGKVMMSKEFSALIETLIGGNEIEHVVDTHGPVM